MSLFRILKGESARISTDKTPFHEGWFYYCTDNGQFYMDVTTGDKQERILLNPECFKVGRTFTWGDLLGDGE